ncbi:MAG: hypothetical protein FWH28_09280 [Clostridiales bacterium]|nr:hypothetical protein [Clostridiales bacterium]
MNIEFEDGSGSAGVAYVPYEQVAEELGVAPYYIFSSSSHWGRDYETYHLMLFVFTQDDDGVIWFMPRTAAFATADMPREVIENYNQRVERGE